MQIRIQNGLLALGSQWLEALLVCALAALWLQLYLSSTEITPRQAEMVIQADQGTASLALRNSDFPSTYIRRIDVDLTAPHHWIVLTWAGPTENLIQNGPFRSSPGGGLGDNNCDDYVESNRGGSRCTPKGSRLVEGFGDYLPSTPVCKFVTWIHSSREIAFHSHPDISKGSLSNGCIRLDEYSAQLIHNNSIAGKTEVVVDGTWTP